MDTDAYLHRTVLHDCQGQVSHTMTLLVDGTVAVDFANGQRALIDPTTRTSLTPTVAVPPALMDQAAQLRPW